MRRRQTTPVNGLVHYSLPAALMLLLFAGTSAHAARPDNKDDCAALPNNSKYNIPAMKIKIFNDSGQYIFPVLTMGKGASDQWMQMFLKIPQKDIEAGYNYPRDKAYRIYINATQGVAPQKYLCVTIPLYTQLTQEAGWPNGINPKKPGAFIDWWNGGTIQLFYNSKKAPPKALLEDRNVGAGARKPRPDLKLVTTFVATSVLPQCKGTQTCEKLNIYEDSADLPKADPSQLIEYTLGARNKLDVPATDKTRPWNQLDIKNVDFDVSYVNVAYGPAAMGPVNNDQVGYVGTDSAVVTFRTQVKNFLADFPGWPQFVRVYADGTKAQPVGPDGAVKLASPLEVLPSLSAPNPRADLTPVQSWPSKIWPPIQSLRDNWRNIANPTTGCITSRTPADTFCAAINDIIPLMKSNYEKYLALFKSGKCSGQPVPMRGAIGKNPDYRFDPTSDLVLGHVYGWGPFTEAAIGADGKDTGTGCKSTENLLQDSSDFYRDIDPKTKLPNYGPYLKVKTEFDELNYNKLKGRRSYVFNPWVTLIHGAPGTKRGERKNYLGIEGAYAYSVDDAVGNVQAWGEGFIIDVGSLKNLENTNPATPPINISVGTYADRKGPKFTKYALCTDTPARYKEINPLFASFILSANAPENCPIYLIDNKVPAQKYTFTVAQPPAPQTSVPPFGTPFPFNAEPAPNWGSPTSSTTTTATYIDCSRNSGKNVPSANFSSKLWCCNKTAKAGAYAYSQLDPNNIHGALNHYINVRAPQWNPVPPNPPGTPGDFNPNDLACNRGQ